MSGLVGLFGWGSKAAVVDDQKHVPTGAATATTAVSIPVADSSASVSAMEATAGAVGAIVEEAALPAFVDHVSGRSEGSSEVKQVLTGATGQGKGDSKQAIAFGASSLAEPAPRGELSVTTLQARFKEILEESLKEKVDQKAIDKLTQALHEATEKFVDAKIMQGLAMSRRGRSPSSGDIAGVYAAKQTARNMFDPKTASSHAGAALTLKKGWYCVVQ